jgi:hypothetical protein
MTMGKFWYESLILFSILLFTCVLYEMVDVDCSASVDVVISSIIISFGGCMAVPSDPIKVKFLSLISTMVDVFSLMCTSSLFGNILCMVISLIGNSFFSFVLRSSSLIRKKLFLDTKNILLDTLIDEVHVAAVADAVNVTVSKDQLETYFKDVVAQAGQGDDEKVMTAIKDRYHTDAEGFKQTVLLPELYRPNSRFGIIINKICSLINLLRLMKLRLSWMGERGFRL